MFLLKEQLCVYFVSFKNNVEKNQIFQFVGESMILKYYAQNYIFYLQDFSYIALITRVKLHKPQKSENVKALVA